MTSKKKPASPLVVPPIMKSEDAVARFASVMDHSQRMVHDFWAKQMRAVSGSDFQFFDPFAAGQAFMQLGAQMMTNPAKYEDLFRDMALQNFKLMRTTFERLQGQDVMPVIEPEPGDKRFSDKTWSENMMSDFIKQSYLITSKYMREMVHGIENLDPESHAKVKFYTRQYINAISPSNFASTNPLVLQKVQETGGENLISGMENLLRDLERGQGKLKISMCDEKAFEVGKNIATTKGKVIYQNDLIQLIQYSPTTKTVYKRPILFVPPWINKFYVLDLQEKNSLIKWTVDQGYTVFVISWVNPRRDLANKGFESYMLEGPLAAMDAIQEATGEKELNLLGFCIGGILSVATLAYMAAKKDNRVKAATFLTTMIDLKDIGEASIFIDDAQLNAMEKYIDKKGYLEGHHMADMFALMRENDLIWSFVVNNYLLGKEPLPFDLLYWNQDSTRLPATMLIYYLRNFYKKNGLMNKGALELNGVPIDIEKIKTTSYFLSTKEDHIAPWASCYPATQKFKGPVRFVLGGSGHIGGVVNPPKKKKYGYRTNHKKYATAEEWLETSKEHDGSWWEDWGKWLKRRSGKRVPARIPGKGGLKAIEDAPGTYVKIRISD